MNTDRFNVFCELLRVAVSEHEVDLLRVTIEPLQESALRLGYCGRTYRVEDWADEVGVIFPERAPNARLRPGWKLSNDGSSITIDDVTHDLTTATGREECLNTMVRWLNSLPG